jgi:hypothetical protein
VAEHDEAISKKDQIIHEVQDDRYTGQKEIQKALKIHSANKKLTVTNQVLKTTMEKMKEEHKNERTK